MWAGRRFGGFERAAALALMLSAFSFGADPAVASEPRQGLSSFGDLKYPPNFQHFDYVNPDAPKGGSFSLIGWGGVTTFDSLNGYILKGDAAQGLDLLFDTLMTRAQDEPDAVYGLVAKTAELADDKMSVTFKLRPQARFSDGSPLRADDVVYSFNALKTQGHPLYREMLQDVVKAEALDPETVRYSFKGHQVRDLPLIVASLPIFSKAYYATHKFDQTTLQPPLGSGPYTIASFRQGQTITYRRNPNYWGKDLPVNRGRWNFDTIRFEYFRDRTAAMEAFKAGAYDFREEFTSKTWATGYDFPAVREGLVKREVLPDHTPSGTQGYFLNTRRPALKDIRVREALELAFDFQWTNKHLFYGLYKRTQSYFENSPMKAEGKPSPAELTLLDSLGVLVPKQALGPVYCPPVTDGSGHDRALLEQAGHLLDEAGWHIKNGVRVNAQGQPLTLEFLNFEPAFERVTAPYINNLRTLGIQARMRMVDPSQYQQRLKSFDFDVTTERYTMNNTPGPELRSYFGSEAANIPGSLNLAGIADPAVDALITRIVEAKSRPALTTAARALDRVLRAGHYWVPHWYKPSNMIAYWDKFSRPAVKPRYDRGILDTWWYDKAKAAKLAQLAAADRMKAPEALFARVRWVFAIAIGIAILLAGLVFLRRKRSLDAEDE
jgi:microcin C transport system substrate-binding protein